MNKNTKNKTSNLDTLSLDVYNSKDFVKSYAERTYYNSHNALYERPATLSLIPDVMGKNVLDAGCGPGHYTDWLIHKGANVTAIDYSDEMLSVVREKSGDMARIFKMNLNFPLEELKDSEFDMVLCSMTIHYIRDWNNLFSEFNRVLKTDGVLILSTHHPFSDFNFNDDKGNYFETELINDEWPSYNIEMQYYRRPLSAIFNTLKNAEFSVDEVLEPQPVDECREKYPDAYQVLSTRPWFLCIKAIKKNK